MQLMMGGPGLVPTVSPPAQPDHSALPPPDPRHSFLPPAPPTPPRGLCIGSVLSLPLVAVGSPAQRPSLRDTPRLEFFSCIPFHWETGGSIDIVTSPDSTLKSLCPLCPFSLLLQQNTHTHTPTTTTATTNSTALWILCLSIPPTLPTTIIPT